MNEKTYEGIKKLNHQAQIYAKQLNMLQEEVEKVVVGQKDAVKAVSTAIKRARVGIAPFGRPWASFLFLGGTT